MERHQPIQLQPPLAPIIGLNYIIWQPQLLTELCTNCNFLIYPPMDFNEKSLSENTNNFLDHLRGKHSADYNDLHKRKTLQKHLKEFFDLLIQLPTSQQPIRWEFGPAAQAQKPVDFVDIAQGFCCPQPLCDYAAIAKGTIRTHLSTCEYQRNAYDRQWQMNESSPDELPTFPASAIGKCFVQKGFHKKYIKVIAAAPRLRLEQASALVAPLAPLLPPPPLPLPPTPKSPAPAVVHNQITNLIESFEISRRLPIPANATVELDNSSYIVELGWKPAVNAMAKHSDLLLPLVSMWLDCSPKSYLWLQLVESVQNRVGELCAAATMEHRYLVYKGFFDRVAHVYLSGGPQAGGEYKRFEQRILALFILIGEACLKEQLGSPLQRALQEIFGEELLKNSATVARRFRVLLGVDSLCVPIPKDIPSAAEQLPLTSFQPVVHMLLQAVYEDSDPRSHRSPFLLKLMCFVAMFSNTAHRSTGRFFNADTLRKWCSGLMFCLKSFVLAGLVLCSVVTVDTYTNTRSRAVVVEQTARGEADDIIGKTLALANDEHTGPLSSLVMMHRQLKHYAANEAVQPSSWSDTAMCFNGQIVHYETIIILVHKLVALLATSISAALDGVPLPPTIGQVRFLHVGSARQPPVVEIPCVAQPSAEFLKLMSMRYTNPVTRDLDRDRMRMWIETIGNKISDAIAMLFLTVGGGMPRATEVVEARWDAQADLIPTITSALFAFAEGLVGYKLHHNKSHVVQQRGGVVRYLPPVVAQWLCLYIAYVRPWHELCTLCVASKELSTSDIQSFLLGGQPLSADSRFKIFSAHQILLRSNLLLYNTSVMTPQHLRTSISDLASKSATEASVKASSRFHSVSTGNLPAGNAQPSTACISISLRDLRQLMARFGRNYVFEHCGLAVSQLVKSLPATVTFELASSVPHFRMYFEETLLPAHYRQFGHAVQTHLDHYSGEASDAVPSGVSSRIASQCTGNALNVTMMFWDVMGLLNEHSRQSWVQSLPLQVQQQVLHLRNGNLMRPEELADYAAKLPDVSNLSRALHSDVPGSAVPMGTDPSTAPADEQTRAIHLSLLRAFTGNALSQFRNNQLDIIVQANDPRVDQLIIAPTGSGKSALLLIPAMVSLSAHTWFLLPTISLLHEYEQRFRQANYQNYVAVLHSSNSEHHTHTLHCLASNRGVILVTYESFVQSSISSAFATSAKLKRVHRVVFDEAHALLTQKHLRVAIEGSIRLVRDAQVAITLATATLRDRDAQSLLAQFAIRPERLVQYRASLWRDNIALAVERASHDDVIDRAVQLVSDVHATNGRAIVYCPLKGQAPVVSQALQERGIRCPYYSTDVGSDARKIVSDGFKNGTVDAVAATSSFGLGVDAPDIRLVVILGAAYDMYDVLQYLGRCGRDGRVSYTYFLYAEELQRQLGESEVLSFASSVLDRKDCARVLIRNYFDDCEDDAIGQRNKKCYDQARNHPGVAQCSNCRSNFTADMLGQLQYEQDRSPGQRYASEATLWHGLADFRTQLNCLIFAPPSASHRQCYHCSLCAVRNGICGTVYLETVQQAGVLTHASNTGAPRIPFLCLPFNSCFKCGSPSHRSSNCPRRTAWQEHSCCVTCALPHDQHPQNLQGAACRHEATVYLIAKTILESSAAIRRRCIDSHIITSATHVEELITPLFPDLHHGAILLYHKITMWWLNLRP